MPSEPRSFLRDRASAEAAIAAHTDCRPAAWSHSQLARLYLERCAETVGEVAECVDCEMGADCVSKQAEHQSQLS